MQILQVFSITTHSLSHCLALSISSINILSVRLQSLIRLTITKVSQEKKYIYYDIQYIYVYIQFHSRALMKHLQGIKTEDARFVCCFYFFF